MKALKSKLASELLADPKALDQLRQFIVAKRPSGATTGQGDAAQFEIHRSGGGTVRVTFVPKAKTA
ncbi:MAG: hypothetical protein M3R60_11120 [Pseudomonadota bacterium]|nr:hypothetical protein [Pseudomonadota bacterium]